MGEEWLFLVSALIFFRVLVGVGKTKRLLVRITLKKNGMLLVHYQGPSGYQPRCRAGHAGKKSLCRVGLGSIRNKNNWNNASKRLFGSYSHSGIPGFHSGYSAPRSRIAGICSGIYSGIYSCSGISQTNPP